MVAQNLQHLGDIEIPDIEIETGWAVSEIATIDDCNDAFALLMSTIAQIEYQIDAVELGVEQRPDEWLIKAKCALKYKKAAIQIVSHKRGSIHREADREFQRGRDQTLLHYIRDVVPEHDFLEWVRASGVANPDFKRT